MKGHEGSKANDHINDGRSDNHNVQKSAAVEGKAERASGGGSAAASEKDSGNMNQKAKDDHPEAPGPVIGMNDERGGVRTFKHTSMCSADTFYRKDGEIGHKDNVLVRGFKTCIITGGHVVCSIGANGVYIWKFLPA